MARSVTENNSRQLWKEVRQLKNSKSCVTNCIDKKTGCENIADLFSEKYSEPYNSVIYETDQLSTITNNNMKDVTMYCMNARTCNDSDKGHSTSHAIITLVNKVSKSLDEGKIVGGVYLDIRKAFDSISHQILLDKLHKIGIRGNIHCLLKSYLMSRSQYVICNGAKSEVKFVETGVPQGSILGPLLFILFMNEFSLHQHYCFLYFLLIIQVFFLKVQNIQN